MKVKYEFDEEKDADRRNMFENGYSFYVGLDDVEKLRKELEDDPIMDSEDLVERLRAILEDAGYYRML